MRRYPLPIGRGVGLGYRAGLHISIGEHSRDIDCLELIAEHFLDLSPQTTNTLSELRANFDLVLHGLNLSLGSAYLDMDYLARIRELLWITRGRYYSEHLAITQSPGRDIGHLTPLMFSDSQLRVCVQKIQRVQAYLRVPLVLENITYPFTLPGSTMTQAAFVTKLVAETGCGLLLDLTNLHTNGKNHGFSAEAQLLELPLEAVVQLHLAGGHVENGEWVDSHCMPIEEETWQLLTCFAKHMRQTPTVIIEHDDDFPPFDVFLAQIARVRQTIGTTVL